MKIELKPMPDSDVGLAVGTLDGKPLVYDGRTPLVAGQPVEHREIASALVDAVDRAASAVFGPEWVKDLSLVTGLNVRTVQRDRIVKYGLPSVALKTLAEASAYEEPRALGYLMLAVARMYEDRAVESAVKSVPTGAKGEVSVKSQVLLAQALEMVDWLRVRRAQHQAPKLEDR
ncbi:hypothetical protein [Microvirga sp. G4-2]|uniref:hypothetical protein n=1 Tax=Microvirga sp. G4-2 TaxID=3434467 RepID=UPI004043D2D8